MFLIGRWDNFDDLEDKLTLEELTTISKAIYDKENSDRRFAAAIQGIDLEKDHENEGGGGEMVDLASWYAMRDTKEIDEGMAFESEDE